MHKDIFIQKKAKKYYDNSLKKYPGVNLKVGIIVPLIPLCPDVDRFKKLSAPQGQDGDQTFIDNGDKKPNAKSVRDPEFLPNNK